ncbi:vinorine synthase-like [Gossypium australe]|uniref:Vinorine synthase-like n=1 Tax=Gossypium australe TaxID=47621 RepID=A0A5B6V4Q7_9ROSI|nr:vinorine synthase-like [Gossypium australe]
MFQTQQRLNWLFKSTSLNALLIVGLMVKIPNPDLLHASSRFFPPVESMPPNTSMEGLLFNQGSLNTRSFVFDANTIAALAARLASGTLKPAILSQAVNIRQRLKPQLPDYSIGNLFLLPSSTYNSVENDLNLTELAYQVREGEKSVTSDFHDLLQGEEGFKVITKELSEIAETVSKGYAEFYTLSSWLNTLDGKEDFGLGKPTLFSIPGVDSHNHEFSSCFILKQAMQHNAIEVWITLSEKDMEMEVQITSKQMVKLSSSKLHLLKPFQLSLIDQADYLISLRQLVKYRARGTEPFASLPTLLFFPRLLSATPTGNSTFSLGSNGEIPDPDLLEAGSRFFPPMESMPTSINLKRLLFNEGRRKSRSFVFDANAIATLMFKAKSKSLEQPSRVASLGAFLWKHTIQASRSVTGSRKPAILCQTVNIRRKMKPQLPDYSIGNLYLLPTTTYNSVGKDVELTELAYLVSEAVKSVSIPRIFSKDLKI